MGNAKVVLSGILFVCMAGCGMEVGESDSLPVWTLEEVFRKDGMADPKVPLNRIGSATVGRDGDLYLTQWQVPEVLVIDSLGEFRRTVGRSGTGPGEFLSPSQLGWSGDSLWVADPRGARIEVFDEDFRPALTIRFSIQPSSNNRYARVLSPALLLGDGTVLARPSGISISGAISGQFSEMLQVHTSREGEVLDTIVAVPITPSDFLSLRIAGDRFIQTSHPVSTMSILVPLLGTPGFF